MKLTDLMFQSLELVQGMEKRLRERRRNATLSLLITLVGIAQQVTLTTAKGNYFKEIGTLTDFFRHLPELTGALLIFGGLAGYATLRWSRFLLQEAEEPFRYTFHIDEFKPVDGTPGNRFELHNVDRLKLLKHDLTERLNQRISRLSILNTGSAEEKETKKLSMSAHIHIEGEYVVREKCDDKWVMQIMGRVRIGAPDRPLTLTHPVKFDLPKEKENESKYSLDADEYNQIVELVYSRVVTEIYRQIEADIQEKMQLFPTAYQRAVALSCEAKDFSRSNTIDAYDRAIVLYRQSLRYFSTTDVKPLHHLTKLPICWRHEARYLHRKASVATGYSECLIYRRKLSTLSGRFRNPIFEVPKLLDEVIGNLEVLQRQITGHSSTTRLENNRAFLTFPNDTWWRKILWRPLEQAFDTQRRIYFDALVASALAYKELGAIETAKGRLEDARAVDPHRSALDPLYLLTAGEIEPDIDTSAQLLQLAADIAPGFQFAKFCLAYCNEMQFRRSGELSTEKAMPVIKAYDDIILNINSGNIAALSSQGYLYWLLGKCPIRAVHQNNESFLQGCGWNSNRCPQYEKNCPRFEMRRNAEKKFKQGLALKSIVQETFVGELNYGLARIAAETGRYNDCCDYFTQAMSADPGVAAHVTAQNSLQRSADVYYEFITPEMMDRYQCYHDEVLSRLQDFRCRPNIELEDLGTKNCSRHTLDVVESFVRNDYGNACFNFYRRMGLPSYLDKAIISYRCAEKADETNAVVYYNLASALLWKRDISPDAVANYFSKAEVLAPTWPSVRTETIRALLKALKHEINSLKYQQRDTRKEIKEFIKTLRHKAERENLFSDEVSSVSATYHEPHGHKEWIDKLLEIKADQRNKLKESTPRMLQILKRSKLALNEIRFGPLLENPSLKTSPQVPHGREESLDELLATKANQWKMRRVIESRLTEILKRLQTSIHETRFGPYLDSLPSKLDYEGVGVNEIARMIVPPDRIDENDISQLNLWAEVLCSNPAALLNGRQLCAVLERYYPEDFWRNLFMLEQLETKLMKPEGRRYPQLREAGQLRKLCKKTICQAIKQDSQHYATLDWLGTPRIGIKIENQIQILKNIKRESSARRLLLGRAYSSNFEWEHAVKNFKKVVELAENEAEYWAELARAQKMLNQWEDVCVAFGHANKLSEGIDEKYYLTELKLAFNEWGNYLYQLRQYRAAGQKYSQALAVDDSDAVIHSNLALAWEQEIPDPTAIKNAIDALNRAIGLAPENLDYVQRLKRLNCLLESLKFYTPDVMAFMPFVNPIALEVAADLIPLISQEDALTPELQESINDMRTAIRNRYGVNVPGIRVRGNENNLPTGTYIILLMEVPLVSGKVSLDRCLIPCASEKLKAYGVITEDAVDPLTGEAATWIDQRDINKIKDLGYDAYDSIGYICRHLQAVIRRNLADINGVQETSALLESESPDLLQAVRNSRHGLVGLTIVFKALLTEEVPITPIRKVVEEFLKLSIEENNLAALAETVRLLPELKRKLPGTQAGVTLFRLTIPFEETLRKSLYGNNEVPVLAMEPETTQGALQAIRNEVADIAHVAIVVQNPVIRPYLRSLVELEFPHLSVITKDEAPEQFAMAVTEIHYDA